MIVREDTAQVWRCTICDDICLQDELELTRVGLEHFAACPRCRSPHVFPALDGGWCKPTAPDKAQTNTC